MALGAFSGELENLNDSIQLHMSGSQKCGALSQACFAAEAKRIVKATEPLRTIRFLCHRNEDILS